MNGMWQRETMALLLIAAALPVAVIWLWFEGPAAGMRLGAVAVLAGLWHLVFMLARAQRPSFAGLVTALYVAMLAPQAGPVPLVLSISFGVVAGELVFGGWGRNVLNPATVSLAFIGFGFPAAPWPELALPVAWAAVPAAGIGMFYGVMSWRLLLAAAAVGTLAWAAGVAGVAAAAPAAAVVLIGLVADPVASAATPLGRWLNGALYAGLAVLFAALWRDAAPVQAAVAAALLASLAAPLLDDIALALWHAERRKRLG